MKKICKECGKLKEHHAHGLCDNCYFKVEYSRIPTVGCGMNKSNRKYTTHVWTNGVTEELKPLIPKIRDKILNDCIKNPSKYLQDFKKRCR